MYKLDRDVLFLISQKAVIKNGNKFLIVRSTFDNLWEMPGGLLDQDETLTNGLKREVKEELGLTASVGQPFLSTVFWHKGKFKLNGKDYRVRVIAIAYQATSSQSKLKLSEEHSEYAWVTPTEMKRYRFSNNSKFIKDHLTK